jgi:hypothetical protein
MTTIQRDIVSGSKLKKLLYGQFAHDQRGADLQKRFEIIAMYPARIA